jgi:amphi-Trp domain-containing protein
MSPETVLFKSEEPKDRAEAAAFLRQLADKVEAGQVVLRQDAGEVTLTLPARLTLEVKAEEEEKRGGRKHSLEVELEWNPDGDASDPGGVSLG